MFQWFNQVSFVDHLLLQESRKLWAFYIIFFAIFSNKKYQPHWKNWKNWRCQRHYNFLISWIIMFEHPLITNIVYVMLYKKVKCKDYAYYMDAPYGKTAVTVRRVHGEGPVHAQKIKRYIIAQSRCLNCIIKWLWRPLIWTFLAYDLSTIDADFFETVLTFIL